MVLQKLRHSGRTKLMVALSAVLLATTTLSIRLGFSDADLGPNIMRLDNESIWQILDRSTNKVNHPVPLVITFLQFAC